MQDATRQPWVALAIDGPVLDLAASIGRDRLQIATDARSFDAAVRRSRPSIAIVAVPPATASDEEGALRLRALDRDLRLVHVTRTPDVERRVDALRRGFDEALSDGIDADELLARLTLLEARQEERASALLPVADGVVLDPVAHQVRRGDAPVHLRPREYRLLETFAANPGRAWTRRELLDRVWGPDHVGDPRTVDVHVRWIRTKIEPRPAAPTSLVTVRGVGYRFDPPRR